MRLPFMRRRLEKTADLALDDRRLRRQFGFFEQCDEIERCGKHRQFAVCRTGPLFARAILIKLDAVVIRIAQIKRFAHAMIGGALERDFCRDQRRNALASAARVG
jgi:hypothetical protein